MKNNLLFKSVKLALLILLVLLVPKSTFAQTINGNFSMDNFYVLNPQSNQQQVQIDWSNFDVPLTDSCLTIRVGLGMAVFGMYNIWPDSICNENEFYNSNDFSGDNMSQVSGDQIMTIEDSIGNKWTSQTWDASDLIYVDIDLGEINAPTVPVQKNTQLNTSVSFTYSETSQTHTAIWDWGDGSTSSGTISENNGSGVVSGNHTYVQPGVYTVSVKVTDTRHFVKYSVFEYIVVYDPNSSKVNGSKEYNSIAGSSTLEPDAVGEVNFGFQIKYANGDIYPSGKNVELSFPEGNIEFESTSYSWLIVNNNSAKFKAFGKLNGVAGYSIIISAIEESNKSGLIRAQISDSSNNIIYDSQPGEPTGNNPTTQISKGKIKIH